MTILPRPALGKQFLTLCALISAVTVTGCTAGGSVGADESSSEAASDDSAEPDGGQDDGGQPDDWFESVTHTGSGDDVVALPDGVEAGLITASHDGSHAFILSLLDDNGESTLDAMITTIGSYEGTRAYGLDSIGNTPTKIEVTADGDWEITIAHLSMAPTLELPAEGSGDAVYQYDGESADWSLTHDGDGAFIVNASGALGGLVMEMGPYEGTVSVPASDGIVTVSADGNWTISQA